MNSQITAVDSGAEFGGSERKMDNLLHTIFAPPGFEKLTTALLMKV